MMTSLVTFPKITCSFHMTNTMFLGVYCKGERRLKCKCPVEVSAKSRFSKATILLSTWIWTPTNNDSGMKTVF